MLIFPAIDLQDGKCVRLVKGDIKKKTVYNPDPLNQAKFFEQCGFKNLHIIDLDFAILGRSKNQKIIKLIKDKTKLVLQVGGGIRSYKDVLKCFDLCIDSIVVGTMFFESRKDFEKSISKFPKKISFGMDLKSDYLAVRGWTKDTKLSSNKLIDQLNKLDLKSVIYTDINRDGTKYGPNIKNLKKFSSLIKVPLVASGGVGNIDHVYALKKIKELSGVIIGKSIYDGTIDLADLIKLQNNA